MSETKAEKLERLRAAAQGTDAETEARSGDLIGDEDSGEDVRTDEPEVFKPELKEPDADERRRQLLAGIAPEIAALISDEELAEIQAEEDAKAESERKANALKSVRASLRQRARVDNDLIPASVLMSETEKKRKNELHTFVFSMPKRGTAQTLRVDGRLFYSGVTYTEPYHVMESIRRQHYLVHLHEMQFRELDQDKVFKRGDDARGFTPAQILLADNPPRFEIMH